MPNGCRTFIGNFIHSRWIGLNIRCSNGKYKHLATKSKCKTYDNININISFDEFKKLCVENEYLISNLQKPSIDRIDNTKDYTISNIQFIELSTNIGKEKIKSKNGRCICYSCKKEKYIEEFSKTKRISTGHSTICKQCDSKRKLAAYYKKKYGSTDND